MNNAYDYNLEEDGVTQSLLSSWKNCRQSAHYYLLGWDSPGTAFNVTFGNLIHNCLERIYKRLYQTQQSSKSLKVNILKIAERELDVWLSQELRSINSGNTDYVQLIEFYADILPVYITEYFKFYPDDITEREWVSVEGEFNQVFKGFRLRGKMDAVYKVSSSRGNFSLMEHKTKGYISDNDIVDLLQYDFQTEIQ